MNLSPFTDRLHTNYQPSEDELQQIWQYIVDPINQLLALDIEILRVQAILDALYTERNKLNDDINAYRALMSPIRQLPHDILQEIFIACLPSDRNAVMSAREAPILLGQVCGTWREISRATPSLWSSIHISIPPSDINDQLAQSIYEAVQMWLARSKTCPLSISLYYPRPKHFASNSYIMKPMMDTILSLSRHWQHVHIDVPPRQMSHLLSLNESDVPLMESLRLNTIYDRWDSFDWKLLRIFQAPRLTSIFTDFMDRSVLAFPFRWTDLTELSLNGWTNADSGLAINDALAILDKCPNLTVCRLAITLAMNVSGYYPQYPMTLLHLHTLSVTEGRQVDAAELFSQLQLPSLRSMIFRTHNKSTDHPPSLLTLLARPMHIENLAFEWSSGSKEDLFECLRMVPYVVRLRVFIHIPEATWALYLLSVFDDECLRRFLPAPNNMPGCLCPRLESLKCLNVSFSGEMLLEFLNARSHTTHPEVAHLKHMHASFNDYGKDDFDVEPFRREGMDISLLYPTLPSQNPVALSPWAGLPVDELQDMVKSM